MSPCPMMMLSEGASSTSSWADPVSTPACPAPSNGTNPVDAQSNNGEITRLIQLMGTGEEGVEDRLMPLLYEELYRLARRSMGGQRPDHTLQASALVNEAYLRIFKDGPPSIDDHQHFLAFAARAMRSILVDHARSKKRAKRSATGERVPLDGLVVSYEQRSFDLVQLDDSLAKLAQFDEALVRLVELRFFGGLTVPETAELLGRSQRSVERDWQVARNFLRKEMH